MKQSNEWNVKYNEPSYLSLICIFGVASLSISCIFSKRPRWCGSFDGGVTIIFEKPADVDCFCVSVHVGATDDVRRSITLPSIPSVSLSAFIERVFFIAPLQDIRRRSCRGRNVVWRTLIVLFMLNERNKCSLRYAWTFGFNPGIHYFHVINVVNVNVLWSDYYLDIRPLDCPGNSNQ